jgi:hypothetical protein
MKKPKNELQAYKPQKVVSASETAGNRVQAQHIRDYGSHVTIVNKGIPGAVKPRIIPRAPLVRQPIKRALKPLVKLRPRPIKTVDDWKKILTVDDGTALPVGAKRLLDVDISRESLMELVDAQPSLHYDEWEKEYIDDPLKELKDKYSVQLEEGYNEIDSKGLKEQIAKEFEQIAKDASAVVENDLSDARVQVSWWDDEVGIQGYYDEVGMEGLEADWVHTGGYSGHYELLPNDDWKIAYDTGVGLGMKADYDAFWKDLESFMNEHDIHWGIVSLGTSNCCYTIINIVVPTEHEKLVKAYAELLDKKYAINDTVDSELDPFHGSVKELINKGFSEEDIMKVSKGLSKEARDLLRSSINKANEMKK